MPPKISNQAALSRKHRVLWRGKTLAFSGSVTPEHFKDPFKGQKDLIDIMKPKKY